jgi:DNA-binding MarR family transcriptional regulator
MVSFVDDLAAKGLVERIRRASDRRAWEVSLTPAGRRMLRQLGSVAARHEEAICAALSVQERQTLALLCQRIADEQGLSRHVHPGFRQL